MVGRSCILRSANRGRGRHYRFQLGSSRKNLAQSSYCSDFDCLHLSDRPGIPSSVAIEAGTELVHVSTKSPPSTMEMLNTQFLPV